MDYNNIEKIVVAPQIVIYKNIFRHSKEMVALLDDDKEGSLFSKWRQWYEQGYRKDALYESYSNPLTSKIAIEEKVYLDEISDALKFISKDYFGMFAGSSGIWPEYVKDWDSFNHYSGPKYIDYFKYLIHEKEIFKDEDIMMHYHVDEFIIPGQFRKKRNVATVNFYLNDEYTGGELCMYDSVSDKNYKYKPKPGDAVIMPSTSPFYHAVKSYRGANRYFLRSFFECNVNEAEEDQYDWDELKRKEEEFVNNDLQLIKISTAEDIVE